MTNLKPRISWNTTAGLSQMQLQTSQEQYQEIPNLH